MEYPMFRKILFLFLCSFYLFPIHAHFMSRIWPQKGLTQNEAGPADATNRVLIAGTGSAFRDTVVSRLVKKLSSDSVYVRIIHFKNLADQNPDEWNVILLVNRCVAWDYDSQVKKFLRGHGDNDNIVVFTTSADPEGCLPEKKQRIAFPVDGYSSASTDEKITPAVDSLYQLLISLFK